MCTLCNDFLKITDLGIMPAPQTVCIMYFYTKIDDPNSSKLKKKNIS